ncbi:hypothetical protein BD408DRAFT_113269 [Parasitella parasitica]|nr:hypothetical protein BD408DRAFT_113269 [Parasitella parasitica]
MNDVFIDYLLDVESDTIQHSDGSKGSLVEDKTIMSLLNVSIDDYVLERGTWPLTISNFREIESEEGMADIIDGHRGPEELEDGVLPNLCLGRVFKEEVVDGMSTPRILGTSRQREKCDATGI